MKYFYYLSVALVLSSLTSCFVYKGKEVQQLTFYVEVKNKLDVPRKDVIVTVPATSFDHGKTHYWMKDPNSAVVTLNGIEIPSQIDYNMDKMFYDKEVVFVTDLPPSSTTVFEIKLSEQLPTKQYPSRTNAQMYAYDKTLAHDLVKSITTTGESNIYSALLHHGPAFESELVGYRVYFNEWQTVDCYGKQQQQLELRDTKFYPTDEQLQAGYGDDVMRVGQTVSVGSLKGWDEETQSIVPFSPVAYRTEGVISSGPLRAIIHVKNEDWQYQGQTIYLNTRYTLYAGHRDVEVDVSYFRSGYDLPVLCTGVMRKPGDIEYHDHDGIIASWSTDFPQDDTVKYARDTVGLAVYIPPIIRGEERSNERNNLYQLTWNGKNKGASSHHYKYYFTFTSKREHNGFNSADEWFDYVKAWKRELENPVSIKIKDVKDVVEKTLWLPTND